MGPQIDQHLSISVSSVADLQVGESRLRFRALDAASTGLLTAWMPEWRPPTDQEPAVAVDLETVDSLLQLSARSILVKLPGVQYSKSGSCLAITTEAAVGALLAGEHRIQFRWLQDNQAAAIEALNTCLYPLLSLAMARHGMHSIHAASVSIEDSAVVILGPSGAGKSTLAGLMADLGATFMSDDTSFVVKGSKLAGIGDYNRPRTGAAPGRESDRNRPRIHRPNDVRLLPVKCVVALRRGHHDVATTRTMPPGELMSWLLKSGTFGMDSETDVDRLGVLGSLASSVPGVVVSLGGQRPTDDMVRDWMSSGGRA